MLLFKCVFFIFYLRWCRCGSSSLLSVSGWCAWGGSMCIVKGWCGGLDCCRPPSFGASFSD